MVFSLFSVILLAFTVLRILQEEGRSARALLVVPFLAAALLEPFAICLAGVSVPSPACQWPALFVEALLPPLWLLVSLCYGRDNGGWRPGRWGGLIILASALLVLIPCFIPADALFCIQQLPHGRLLLLSDAAFSFYLAVFVLLLIAMANLEASLVTAGSDLPWRRKLELLAMGSLLAGLIYYYGHVLWYRAINLELLQFRSLVFTLSALIMAYARLKGRGGAHAAHARSLLFGSVVLAAVPGFFLVPALSREGIGQFGPQLGRPFVLSLAFLAAMFLVLLLLSDSIKREVKVYLHKLFYLSKYDYRTQWLGFTETIASARSSEELQHRVLTACCDMFGVQGGALFLHQEAGGWLCSAGVRELEKVNEMVPENNLLVDYLRERRWVFSSRDHNPEIVAQSRDLIEQHQISFVIPLFVCRDLLGFIALGPQLTPDEKYCYEDYDLMKAVARQAGEAIQRQRISEQLAQARAMEVVGSLATFVVHDLKNLAATTSLLVENAEGQMDNQEFRKDMLSCLRNSTKKMQRLIERLRNLKEKELVDLQPVDLFGLVQRCVVSFQGVVISVKGDHVHALVDEEDVQQVVVNLLLNAVEASCPDAEIVVEVGFAEAPFIKVTDQGCGMSQRFVQRELFVPFRTTKRSGLGIGLYQCRQIVAAHGGKLAVHSAEGRGTVFTVWFQSMNKALGATQTA